jgi:hypothetical protein
MFYATTRGDRALLHDKVTKHFTSDFRLWTSSRDLEPALPRLVTQCLDMSSAVSQHS